MKFPQNILLTLPHASFDLPKEFIDRLAPDMKNNEFRLVKNFSDFGTVSLLHAKIPNSQVIISEISRALGDHNRALDEADCFRETDFNNIPIWAKPLTTEIKELALDQYYAHFHDAVQKKINTGKFDLLVDVHDTGNRLLGPLTKDDVDRNPKFCDICISNNDDSSCPPELLETFAKLLIKHTGYTVQLNDPYKGGFITRYYGEQLAAIQVEFNRSLYMDERRQAVEPEQAKKLADGFYAALCELADFL